MSVPPDEAQLLQALVNALGQVRAANYGIVSSCAFLFYDVALTMTREISYIWRQKWSFPKIVYLCVRYYGVAYLVAMCTIQVSISNSTQTCRRYFAFVPLGGPIIFTTISNVILMLRVHALYDRNSKILTFLVLLTLGQFATDLYAAIRTTAEDVSRVIPPPLGLPWPGCFVSPVNTRYTLISWIPLLIVATIFFIMTLLNFIRIIRLGRRFERRDLLEVKRISPFLTAFIRDGTVFYLILLVTLVISMVLTAIVEGPIGLSATAWLIAMYSFATSRLILNLREFAHRSGNSTITWDETLSTQVLPEIVIDEGHAELQVELQ